VCVVVTLDYLFSSIPKLLLPILHRIWQCSCVQFDDPIRPKTSLSQLKKHHTSNCSTAWLTTVSDALPAMRDRSAFGCSDDMSRSTSSPGQFGRASGGFGSGLSLGLYPCYLFVSPWPIVFNHRSISTWVYTIRDPRLSLSPSCMATLRRCPLFIPKSDSTAMCNIHDPACSPAFRDGRGPQTVQRQLDPMAGRRQICWLRLITASSSTN